MFNHNVEGKAMRRKLAEQYMFELYQFKEFLTSGFVKLIIDRDNSKLGLFLTTSDESLFSILKVLKERYPQTPVTSKK